MADKHLVNLFSPTRRAIEREHVHIPVAQHRKKALPEGAISSTEIEAIETAQFTSMP